MILTASIGRILTAICLAAALSARAEPSALRGENVYARACAACHGYQGDGKGAAAPNLDPRPRDFTTGMFKFRTTPSGELPTDADLLRIVEAGIPGSQMPGWKRLLSKSEREDVVAYLKTFSADFKDGAPPAIDIPAAPAATERSIAEGKMVYMLMECWACHGGRGKGDGKSVRTLEDDAGRRIPAWDLRSARYKAGNDPETLYRTFTTGLNGTPMPAYALDGFLIAGDAKVDPAKYQEAYQAADIDALRAWLRTQPVEGDLQRMNPEQRGVLGERRKWALVHYCRSLVRHPNFLIRMFTENTEYTR